MKKHQLARTVLSYGALAGFLGAALMIGIYYMGRHPMLISPLLDFRILLYGVFIFFGLREFREYFQAGVLYFWQGMIGGFVVVVVASTLASAGLWLFGSLEADFVRDYITGATEYLNGFPEEEKARIGKETFERNLSSLQTTNISDLIMLYFAQSYLIGFFVSIILSVILRRQPKP